MPKPPRSDEKRFDPVADRELWRKVVAGVQPLKGKTAKRAGWKTETFPPPQVADQPLPRRDEKPAAVPPPLPKPAPGSPIEDLEVGKAVGVDKRTLARLRRGLLPVEARIDLHNMTQEQAHRALIGFLAAAQNRGKRCVLVITGKGLRTPCGPVGVLKNAVPRWLNDPAQRSRIIAITHAPPNMGGEGALLILLKRIRRDRDGK